jgi:hypothetical protein
MSTQIQRRRGTTAEHSTFTGVEGELTVDTTKDTAVVHDGTTVGGHPLQKQYPPLGSAAAPTYTFTGDTNTGIYSPGADQVAVATNGTQRLLIKDASQDTLRVSGVNAVVTADAIGSNYPGFRLAVNGSVLAGFDGDGGTSANLFTYAAVPLVFGIDSSERLRITSAGLVGIGTSSPSSTAGGLDISSGGIGLVVGADGSTVTRTNSTDKIFRIGSYHYTNAEEPVCIAFGQNLSSDNELNFGGGSAALNAATYIRFFTAANNTTTTGTERVRIDNAGRVGIGTTTLPANTNLTVLGNFQSGFYRNVSSGARGYFINIGSNSSSGLIDGAYILGAIETGDANGNLSFGTRTSGTVTEKVRIDSSGRLLVGTSTNIKNLRGEMSAAIVTTGNNTNAGLGITGYCGTPSAAYPLLDLQRSRGVTDGSMTVVASGDTLGALSFRGADGTNFLSGASIIGEVDGTPGASDMPGRLVFSTTADGASSPTERMRITSGGQVNIGAPNGVGTVGSTDGITFDPVGNFGICATSNRSVFSRRATDGSVLEFRRDTTGVGSISVTTTATAYNTSSDYRLKENVTAVTDGITRLQQLKPSRFNFIADSDTVVDGFLAHEVQTVVPEAITGEKDAVDEEGNPEYQGIDQSKLVPLLTAALQEAVAKIESLEARLTAAGI